MACKGSREMSNRKHLKNTGLHFLMATKASQPATTAMPSVKKGLVCLTLKFYKTLRTHKNYLLFAFNTSFD